MVFCRMPRGFQGKRDWTAPGRRVDVDGPLRKDESDSGVARRVVDAVVERVRAGVIWLHLRDAFMAVRERSKRKERKGNASI